MMFCLMLPSHTESLFFILFNVIVRWLFLSAEPKKSLHQIISRAWQMEDFFKLHPPATLWDTMFSCLLTQTGNQLITRQQLKDLCTLKRSGDKFPRLKVSIGYWAKWKWFWRWWMWLLVLLSAISQTADRLGFFSTLAQPSITHRE